MSEDDIVELTREQEYDLLDRSARRVYGISGFEFVRRWRAGTYGSCGEDPRAFTIAMYIPEGLTLPDDR